MQLYVYAYHSLQVIVPTIEKLEKLFFLLSAFENNLRELKKIQKSLHEILHKVTATKDVVHQFTCTLWPVLLGSTRNRAIRNMQQCVYIYVCVLAVME